VNGAVPMMEIGMRHIVLTLVMDAIANHPRERMISEIFNGV
jgi:hypothetical protein